MEFTDIRWIGKNKTSGSEYSRLTRTFTLDAVPAKAVVRYASEGHSLLYLNGAPVEGLGGRLPGRVGCFEVAKKLKKGENTIEILLGGHFYQDDSFRLRKERGRWFSRAALELLADDFRLVTDESWSWTADTGSGTPEVYTNVSCAEYARFWKKAARWEENPEPIPDAIKRVAGEEYVSFASTLLPETITPVLLEKGERHAVWDFSRVCVGFFILNYDAASDGQAKFTFDYAEELQDLTNPTGWWKGPAGHVSLTEEIKKGRHTLFVTRRRACHYLRIDFSVPADALNLTLRVSIKPYVRQGWFHSGDKELDRIWEVGRYTLLVNRHQEYESCPRHEVKFFAGDGVPDALTDYYAFGDPSLTDASLSIVDSVDAAGLVFSPLQTSVCLTDYPAWRIIMAYNHYVYTGDRALIESYYDELYKCAEWLESRANTDGLMVQYPIQTDPFFMFDTATEYNSSGFRFGEKPYLNAVYYRALTAMAAMAALIGRQEDAEAFTRESARVKKAFNERLWDEEKGAYLDSFDHSYIPQDGNALAVLFGLCDEARTRRIFETSERELWTPYGSPVLSKTPDPENEAPRCNDHVLSPMMNGYEAEARFLNGDADGAIQMIRACWGTMVKKGAETFWEFADADATTRWPVCAHAWSSSCTYLLQAYVGGLRPAEPGFKKLLFAPCTDLDFTAVVPTPYGLTSAKAKTENGTKLYTLCLPEGMDYEARLPEGAKINVIRY